MDALLATVQMPTGIPVATVAIDGASNAALLAVAMLAIGDEELTTKLTRYRKDLAEKTLAG
jgi:5-(carboxyamino)imidazole ribonucleotide mutase